MSTNKIDIRTLKFMPMRKPESCSHEITRGYFENPNELWYCKAMPDATRARFEVLGQEFYRLFIQAQPQMRLAQNFETEQYFVLSREIINFQAIPFDKKSRLTNGVYTGLGQILIVSIFLHEIDLNLGNLGLDHQNRLIKLDGDWMFASFISPTLFADKLTDITPELLKKLPYLSQYDAHNWLDIIQTGFPNLNSSLFSDDLINAAHFRDEINTAILQIILLPDEYIHKFVALYLSDNVEQFTQYLLQRKTQLRASSAQNSDFIRFLSTLEATQVVYAHLQYTKDFTTEDGLSTLQPHEHKKYEQQYIEYWSKLRSQFINSPQTVTDLNALECDDLYFDEFDANSSASPVEQRYRMFSITPSSKNENSPSPIRFNRTFSNLSTLS